MIPRYRGKLKGGRPKDHRRRHRAAILIEIARFGASLLFLYAAGICFLGVAFAVGNRFGHDFAATAARIPVVRQFGVQAGIVADLNDYLPIVGLVASLIGLGVVHFIANFLVDDVVDR